MEMVDIKKLSLEQRDNFFNIILYNDKVIKYNKQHEPTKGEENEKINCTCCYVAYCNRM